MSIARQGKWFLIVGGTQWLLDWGVTVALSHAGMALETANVIGRIVGASIGFWLNGWITFASSEFSLGRVHALRFVVVWLAMTALSTLLVGLVGTHAGLRQAWLAKPVIELALAALSFLLSRQWVYR